MKIVRFAWAGETLQGILDGDTIHALEGDVYGTFWAGTESVPAASARLVCPVAPTKVLCVGANYHTYSLSGGVPTYSLKVPTAWLGPDEPVTYPKLSTEVIMEAELAVVIGRTAKDVSRQEATDHVLGYTVANDLTARDIMKQDGRPSRAKNFDGFCPLGPVIETELDPSDLRIVGRVNGEIRQEGSTKDMIADVAEVVERFSAVMTLNPGDVLLTATPSPPPYVEVGDVLEAEVEGIGILRNHIVDATGV